MTLYRYSIDATWRVEPTSPEALGKKFLTVLDTVSNSARRNEGWQLGKPPYMGEFVTIEEAQANLAEWVEENPILEDGRVDPDTGYRLMALNLAQPRSRMLSFIADIGGRLGDNLSF